MELYKIVTTYEQAENHAKILAYWHHQTFGIFNWGFNNRFMVAPINTPHTRFETLIRVVH